MAFYISVDIPSEVHANSWWQWGTFDTVEEAVCALKTQGIPVDEDGYLLLITEQFDHTETEE